MKNIMKLMKLMISMMILLISTQLSNAQPFTFSNPAGNGDIGYTTSTITGIGIGPFTGNIGAALHVNTNILPAQSSGFSLMVQAAPAPTVHPCFSIHTFISRRYRNASSLVCETTLYAIQNIFLIIEK